MPNSSYLPVASPVWYTAHSLCRCWAHRPLTHHPPPRAESGHSEGQSKPLGARKPSLDTLDLSQELWNRKHIRFCNGFLHRQWVPQIPAIRIHPLKEILGTWRTIDLLEPFDAGRRPRSSFHDVKERSRAWRESNGCAPLYDRKLEGFFDTKQNKHIQKQAWDFVGKCPGQKMKTVNEHKHWAWLPQLGWDVVCWTRI